MQKADRPQTVRSQMKRAISALQEKGIDEARLNVELLLSHALRCQRIALYSDADRQMNEEEIGSFGAFLDRRIQHEPLQYIVGSTSFMGLPFRVDPRVLIPRPETETLVEELMLSLNARDARSSPTVLDIGTGCGNIAIAIAKFVRPVAVTALDSSPEALEVARLNARVHEVEGTVRFLQADLFGPIENIGLERFTHVVSNPPYGTKEEWSTLDPEIRLHEPRLAVTDEDDGYRFHRRIAELAPHLLTEGGAVFLEVGWNQADEVRRILTACGAVETAAAKDLQGIARVVRATFQPLTRPTPSAN